MLRTDYLTDDHDKSLHAHSFFGSRWFTLLKRDAQIHIRDNCNGLERIGLGFARQVMEGRVEISPFMLFHCSTLKWVNAENILKISPWF